MSSGVNPLREVLLRAVRTLMTEVDRQRTPRLRFERPATMTLAGRSFTVIINNISDGGLMASGMPQNIQAGMRVKVAIADLAPLRESA